MCVGEETPHELELVPEMYHSPIAQPVTAID